MCCFKFEIDQVVEMVRGSSHDQWMRNLFCRFFRKESTVEEFMDMDKSKDGDLFQVKERWTKEDRRKLKHDLYLCENLKTKEWTLFGRTGLREHFIC
jgi:hypothetical protein